MGGSKRRSRRELLRDGLTVAAGAALLPAIGCPTDEPCEPADGGDDDSAGDGCVPVSGELANDELERTVIRVHDTRVTDYDYSDPVASPSHSRIDGDVLAAMLAAGVVGLTGAPDARTGWAGLLGDYSCDDRVVIKVNFNSRSGADEGKLNNSAAMVLAVMDALVDLGICPGHISVLDASRGEIANVVDPLRVAYPDGNYLFYPDVPRSESEVLTFPSLIDGETGAPLEIRVPAPVVEAQHLIDLHLFKGHFGGVTGALKNMFGLARDVWNTVHGSRDGWPRWDSGVQCAELAAHPVLRDRQRLSISEALFGTHNGADRVPDPYVETRLWGSDSPSSLVLSTNPVCHDSVLLSLIRAEREAAGEDNGQADHWLASAAAEPYSLGIHEEGVLTEGEDGRWDMTFEEIRYRTVWMEEG
jgi:hypothetical protein